MTVPRATGISTNEAGVQRIRAWTGLYVVIGGDVVIAVAAIFAVYKIGSDATSSGAIVSVLTSAFTAVSTMTTAYFGIRAATNTAQTSLSSRADDNSQNSPRS